MERIILLVGGARSGKSSFAERLAKQKGKHLVYLATGEANDEEMYERIKKHKRRRRDLWKVIEEPINLSGALAKILPNTDVVMIDCITLWISNLLLVDGKEGQIKKEIKKLLVILAKAKFTTIIVSNEVGGGIVPADPVGRRYRDLLGMVNQLIAKKADIVYQMYCGIPVKVKGGRDE